MGWQDDQVINPAATQPDWKPLDPVLAPAVRAPQPAVAQDIIDAAIAGVQSSATGLAARGKLPTLAVGESAPWYHRLAANVAGVVTDLPLSIAGAIPGAAVGAAAGPGGAVVGGGAGAFAAPMALREALMTAYGQNAARSWRDVWEITKSALTGGAKGAVIGGATLGAGRVVGPLVAGAGPIARVAAPLGAELGALTVTAAALEGHVPTAQDFLDNAILLGGMKGAVAVAARMRQNYAETGKKPEQQLQDALADPALRDALVKGEVGYDLALPPVSEGFVRVYRGEDMRFPTGGEWAATDKAVAASYAEQSAIQGGKGGRVVYQDVPKAAFEFTDRAEGVGRVAKEYREGWLPTVSSAVVPEAYRNLAIEERVRAAIKEDPRPELIRERMSDALKEEPPLSRTLSESDPVRYEYVVDGPTAQGVLRSVEAMYRHELETQRRGTVPDKATAIEGLKKVTEGIPEHIIGEAESASMIFARAHLLRGAADRASAIMKELALKNPLEITEVQKLAAYAELERVAMMHKELAGSAAEVGRALHILRSIKNDPAMLGEAKTLVTLFERKGKFQDIAAMAAALKDPAQLAKFAKDMQKATTTEQVIEAWKAAILSGPQTHMANMMGNLMRFAVEIPESTITAGITAVRRALEGDTTSLAEFKAKALSPLYGLKWGTRDALTIAVEVLKEEGAHLEKADVYRAAIPGKAGHWVRLPFRALQAEDVLFRTVGERGRAHELAVERAVKEGFKPETREFNDKVATYTLDPGFGLSAKDAAARLSDIQNAGAESVFAQRLGPRMEQAQAAMAGSALQFAIPFVRTPVNLLSWAVQHSPGFLLSARWRNDFKAGGVARDRAIARVLVGAGLTITALSLAQEGFITGGGMFDPETRRAKTAAGWQPYSFKIGDKYYSYQRLEPVAKVIGFAADWLEMDKKLEDDDRAKGAMVMLAMFGNATISTTYLSGLAGAFNAVTDPQRYGEQWFEQYASSLIPKTIGQTAMLIDPHKREVNGVLDSIQSQLPYFREKLMPARDVWGEPKKNEKLFGVLPVQVSEAAKEKVKTEAMRLELALTDVPKFLYEAGPLKPGERQIELTPEQRDIARVVSGTKATEILAPIVNSPDWNNIPDFAKAIVYKRVLEAARVQGRLAGLPATAPEREAMRRKIIEEINRQSVVK